MVRHQNVSVNLTLVLGRGLPETIKIEAVIPAREKGSLVIVAALDDVLGHARKAYTWSPRHVDNHASSSNFPERTRHKKVDLS